MHVFICSITRHSYIYKAVYKQKILSALMSISHHGVATLLFMSRTCTTLQKFDSISQLSVSLSRKP